MLVALAIAIGLVGIVLPVLPGSLLIFAAIAVWAIVENNATAWVTLAVVAVIFAITLVTQYLWPVRRMRSADISTRTLLVGGVLGVIGFFVIPVIGLALGFVVGVYSVELNRHRDQARAWTSTVHAIKGVALSMGLELTGALMATVVWVTGVLVTP